MQMRAQATAKTAALGLAALALACLLAGAAARAAEAPFDIDSLSGAVLRVEAKVPAEARTGETLGRRRAGNGVVIDDGGLVLTIGYLVLEATEVTLTAADGRAVPAAVVGYDHETGFGLLRALGRLQAAPMRFGESAALREGEPVLVLGHGGRTQALGAFVVDVREFAGYWEYLLEGAIFTSPPHPNWGGAALIDRRGRLVGIGSLMVPDARRGERAIPGNMFVPIAALRPILADLLAGTDSRPRRPWLGVTATDGADGVVVVRVAPDSPAERAGLRRGDIIRAVSGRPAHDIADLYRKVWSLGGAGVEVPLEIRRDGAERRVTVHSGDRYSYLKLQRDY